MTRVLEGVLDRVAFPPRLTAHVVEPGEEPRIHGYAVESELGHAAEFGELGWLALRGELPSPTQREALSRALIWLAPLHVGDGPTHAAVLARVAGAPDEVLPAIASAALGQHVSAELDMLAPWFAWLDDRSGAVPEVALARAPTATQIEAHARLLVDTQRWFTRALVGPGCVLRRVAAAYGLLHQLGVRDRLSLHAFANFARLPVVLAEAAHMRLGAVLDYPARVPDYRYVEDPT